MSHPSEPVNDPYELAEPAGVPDRLPTSVLEDAHDAITGQRRTDYGSPLESFQRIADIASAGLSHKLTEPLEPEDINWLLLYALKGSRAAHGLQTGTFHRDTYIDTAGYAGCAELIHNEREGNGS